MHVTIGHFTAMAEMMFFGVPDGSSRSFSAPADQHSSAGFGPPATLPRVCLYHRPTY